MAREKLLAGEPTAIVREIEEASKELKEILDAYARDGW
jgi:hypothetical protein